MRASLTAISNKKARELKRKRSGSSCGPIVSCYSPNARRINSRLMLGRVTRELGERAGNIAHSLMLRDLAITNAENIA